MQICSAHKYFAILTVILTNVNYFAQAGIYQRRLISKLFATYDETERPVLYENSQVDVQVGLTIQNIVDIDEKKQIIVFSGWLIVGWNDPNLVWNPVDFGNITKISVMSSKIWTPDLMLYSSAGDEFKTNQPVNAIIHSNGDIEYQPPKMFRSNCLIEIYQFPFDEQFCLTDFGSWTLDTTTVNLRNMSATADLGTYVENGEWSLESAISYSRNLAYECCPGVFFPHVYFEIHVRRRTLYFILNFVFPCVLISFMSILGFCLPPDSGEKIGLEMTTLLSIIMFSQLITGIIPESSLSVPKISSYFASITIICTLCILANVVVLILHHQNIKIQRPMPPWIELWICQYLATFLQMKYPLNKSDPDPAESNIYRGIKTDVNEASSKSLLANVLDINDDYFNKSSIRFKNRNMMQNEGFSPVKPILKKQDSGDEDYSQDPNLIKRNLGAILKEIKTLTKKIEDDDADEEKVLKWKFAAMVIDRLCMFFFTVATFLSTVMILLTSKNFFKLV